MDFDRMLTDAEKVYISQRVEKLELFGFETRNSYSLSTAAGALGVAAEGGADFGGFIARYFMGHHRHFELRIADNNRNEVLKAVHPFRFLFRELHISHGDGRLGYLKQRFALWNKHFEVYDRNEQNILTMRGPRWKIWTFPVLRQGEQVAVIKKKWSGPLKELFTDADTFLLEFESLLSLDEKKLLLAASLFVDILYFEKKSS